MIRSSSILLAASALLCLAGVASAQTPASLTIVSGNGQMICQCPYGGYAQYFFSPLVVRVTDATGAPLSGVAVDWSITSGGYGGAFVSTQTTTDFNGLASGLFSPSPAPFGNGFIQFQQTGILASTAGLSAPFTLTQGIQTVPASGSFGIQPFYISQGQGTHSFFEPLVGPVGSTVTPPFKIQVLSTTTNQPIPNVAV